MPTYQYACTECGDRSEAVQRFSDDPLTVCSVCGGKLRKVFSPVGIVFKGSGFYRTDSRKGSSTVPAGKDGANGSSSESSSNGDSAKGDSQSDSSKGDSGKSAKSDSAKPASGSSSSSSSGSSGDSKSSSVPAKAG